jgi:protein-disulfide isomerase
MKLSFLQLALMGAAFVTANSFAKETTNESVIVSNIKSALVSASPRNSSLSVKVDHELSNIVHEFTSKKSVWVVDVDGTKFATDDEGSYFSQPQSFIVYDKNGITALSSMFEDHAIAKNNTNWPSHKVNDGVEKKGDLYVFTDPTCGYCKKVDSEMDQYLDAGIEVHYIPYIRSGLEYTDAMGYQQWRDALCYSKDPAKAYHYTIHPSGDKLASLLDHKSPEPENCDKLIAEGYKYGQTLGISGTPFMYVKLLSGDLAFKAAGYVEASELISNAFKKAD